MTIYIIVVFLILISTIKYLEETVCLACWVKGNNIISFILGGTIVSIFILLLNDIYLNIHSVNKYLVALLPISFAFFALIGNHIYKHKNKLIEEKELIFLSQIVSSTSGFIVGIISISTINNDIIPTIAFLGTLLSYELIDELPLHSFHINKEKKAASQVIKKILFALSPFYGFSLALIIKIPETVNVGLLTIFGGALFYTLTREFFSQERKNVPLYFISGIAIMTLAFAVFL